MDAREKQELQFEKLAHERQEAPSPLTRCQSCGERHIDLFEAFVGEDEILVCEDCLYDENEFVECKVCGRYNAVSYGWDDHYCQEHTPVMTIIKVELSNIIPRLKWRLFGKRKFEKYVIESMKKSEKQ